MLNWLKYWMRRLPTISSLMLGGGLFVVAYALFPPPRDTIVIDRQAVETILEDQANLVGHDLSETEREEALQRFIEDEILLLEAFRSGRHLMTGSARRRLVREMRPRLVTGVPEPTTSQLHAYYEANAARYRADEALAVPAFEEVRAQVELDWIANQRTELMNRKLERMRSRYDIEVEGDG